LKITSNALVTLVRAEQDCFKELFEAVNITRRSLSSSGCSEFQTVGPATGKARGRMCWVDSEAQWVGVGWRNVADVAMQLPGLEISLQATFGDESLRAIRSMHRRWQLGLLYKLYFAMTAANNKTHTHTHSRRKRKKEKEKNTLLRAIFYCRISSHRPCDIVQSQSRGIAYYHHRTALFTRSFFIRNSRLDAADRPTAAHSDVASVSTQWINSSWTQTNHCLACLCAFLLCRTYQPYQFPPGGTARYGSSL